MGTEVEENKKFALDFDKMLPFVREQICCSHMLSKAVIEEVDFTKGSFHTVLPKDTDVKKLYDFKTGNIVSQTIPGERRSFEGLGPVWYVPLVSTQDYLNRFTEDYLRENSSHCVIVDDYESEPGQSNQKIENVDAFYLGMEVYHLLKSKNQKDEIETALFRAFLIWHSLVIFTSHSENFINGNSLDVKKACENPKYIVVGAYDGESYIFWEPYREESASMT